MARTIYLTGSTNPMTEALVEELGGQLGLLATPNSNYSNRVERFPWWAADNGCFSNRWDADTWWAWLNRTAERIDDLGQEIWDRCLFAVAPDVVGDARATLEKSLPWFEKIRSLGFPVAFVAQDGSSPACWSKDQNYIERSGGTVREGDWVRDMAEIPWGSFDYLFLGGSTHFKVTKSRAGRVVDAARARNIPIHMGRVNSYARLQLANSWGCSSADGNFLTFGPEKNAPRMKRWFDKRRRHQNAVPEFYGHNWDRDPDFLGGGQRLEDFSFRFMGIRSEKKVEKTA